MPLTATGRWSLALAPRTPTVPVPAATRTGGAGSGYGCALLARRPGADHVTSVDIDGYLVTAATAASCL